MVPIAAGAAAVATAAARREHNSNNSYARQLSHEARVSVAATREPIDFEARDGKLYGDGEPFVIKGINWYGRARGQKDGSAPAEAQRDDLRPFGRGR